jgi:hypothetical protein
VEDVWARVKELNVAQLEDHVEAESHARLF